jgi:hypothetical protein
LPDVVIWTFGAIDDGLVGSIVNGDASTRIGCDIAKIDEGANPNRLSKRSVSLKTEAVKDTEVLGMWSRPVTME